VDLGECSKVLEKEAQVQSEGQHQAVTEIILFDRTVREDVPFLITRLAQSDMAQYMKKHGPFSFEDAYTLSLNTADAINNFHKKRIVVSDLQPANVLLFRARHGKLVGKLADFGGAVHLGIPEEYAIVSDDYAPPEFGNVRSNFLFDVYGWAAGIVYPAFTGHVGFPMPFGMRI
jgi:serine/threonine protein kinase